MTPRFWPEMVTLRRRPGGALCPRYPFSAMRRVSDTPICCSMAGTTAANVWPSYGLPGSAATWAMNWGVSSEWGDHAALANRSFWLACG